MKKVYNKPTMTVTSFEAENIMKLSGGAAEIASTFTTQKYNVIF